MIYTELGKSGIRISRIGLGTWQYGSRSWGWGREYGEPEAIEAIRRSIELGVNFIDTAEIYGDGKSEEIVGKAIRGLRDEVVIATKVWVTHLTYDGVIKALERSRRRLGVDVVDLYQVHWPNPLISIKQTMRAMERLVKEGKVRCIGVSNFSLKRMLAAQEALSREEIASNQVKYNLIEREPEKELIPYAERNKVTIISYSPLAQGLLTGKYGPDNQPRDAVRRVNYLFDVANLRRVKSLLDVMRRISSEKNCTMAQLALRWIIRRPVAVAIPGAKSSRQAEENARSVLVELTEEDAEELERVSSTIKLDRFLSMLRLPLRLLRP